MMENVSMILSDLDLARQIVSFVCSIIEYTLAALLLGNILSCIYLVVILNIMFKEKRNIY